METELDRRIRSGDLPEVLRGVLLDQPWDIERLLALDLPVGRTPVADLGWHLDLPFWREDGRWFALTPNEVRRHPGRHEEQWQRTLDADLRFPIHLTYRDARPTIIDGLHRLLKTSIEGRTEIVHRFVPRSTLPLFARTD
jgi:hypothetical protein